MELLIKLQFFLSGLMLEAPAWRKLVSSTVSPITAMHDILQIAPQATFGMSSGGPKYEGLSLSMIIMAL